MISDYLPLLLVFGGVGAVAVAVYLLSPAVRAYARQILTAREWTAVFQIFAIVVMTAILVSSSIAFEFGSEQFIYGRF